MCFYSALEFIDKLFVHGDHCIHYSSHEHLSVHLHIKFNHKHNSHHHVDILQLYKYDIHLHHNNFLFDTNYGHGN
jgi:hypothetical protein